MKKRKIEENQKKINPNKFVKENEENKENVDPNKPVNIPKRLDYLGKYKNFDSRKLSAFLEIKDDSGITDEVIQSFKKDVIGNSPDGVNVNGFTFRGSDLYYAIPINFINQPNLEVLNAGENEDNI